MSLMLRDALRVRHVSHDSVPGNRPHSAPGLHIDPGVLNFTTRVQQPKYTEGTDEDNCVLDNIWGFIAPRIYHRAYIAIYLSYLLT